MTGVGPHPRPWPSGDQYDPELLEHGDTRNVVDRYRYWKLAAIVADLDTRRHDFHVAIENLAHDFNIGSIIRTANAFGAKAIHIVGRKRWNRRGAMVTDRYQHVVYHPDPQALRAWANAEGLVIVGVENGASAQAIETSALPSRCILLFGQEGSGLSEEAIAVCDRIVAITQFGSTRSINVGAAASIAMHAWIRRHRFGQQTDTS